MSDVYVIRNQQGHYWGKSKEWVSGSDPKTVVRAKHQDEAINTLFELSSKDMELRGEVVSAQLSEKGHPVIEASQIPLPSTEDDSVEDEEPQTAAAVETAEATAEEASLQT
jgi:hypothetical protein